MNKVKFGEDDSHTAELQNTAKLEKAQADDATRQLTRILRRIDNFYEAIDYVAFSSAEEAPIWAPNWKEWLQTGVFPVPDIVEATPAGMQDGVVYEEAAPPDDQPGGDDPDDKPPLAATG